jgi:hypothetical protein
LLLEAAPVRTWSDAKLEGRDGREEVSAAREVDEESEAADDGPALLANGRAPTNDCDVSVIARRFGVMGDNAPPSGPPPPPPPIPIPRKAPGDDGVMGEPTKSPSKRGELEEPLGSMRGLLWSTSLKLLLLERRCERRSSRGELENESQLSTDGDRDLRLLERDWRGDPRGECDRTTSNSAPVTSNSPSDGERPCPAPREPL